MTVVLRRCLFLGRITDTQTLPILPNLLDELLSLDPSTPTYFGTALGTWTGFHHYFGGMMYGMTWHVVSRPGQAQPR